MAKFLQGSGVAVLWDGKKDKPVYEFKQGELETGNIALIGKLEKAGYDRVDSDEAAEKNPEGDEGEAAGSKDKGSDK
jgi:hypothetical protein